MQLLENYIWHGNVRELEHTIERAVALERGDEIQPERLPDHITNYNPERINAEFDLPDEGINLTAHLENLEKTYVVEALRKTSGNQTRAAELLQMQVRSLRHCSINTISAPSPPRCETATASHRFIRFARRPDISGGIFL